MSRFLLLLTILPTAFAQPDARGWSEGQMAAGAARVMAGPDTSELPELEFAKDFVAKMGDKTVLFYFSPGCPHCQAVGKEFGDLARSLKGKATVIGVASASSDPIDVEDFKRTYGIDFEVVIDSDNAIQSNMGVRSTPSVLMVAPKGKKHQILDAWYPYQTGFDTYVKMRVLDDPWKAFDGSYLGNGSCAACHQQEYSAWALTHHSVAWRTLTNKGEDHNEKCTGCHVTGDKQPTGWTGANTPDLVDVGCESCHGPSGPHDGERTEPASTCEGCHDAEHSIQFEVAKGLPLIDHYAANALSDEAFSTKRMALLDGELPRPLLAFGADKALGAEACKECHEAEYAQWATTPHHKAMTVLRDQEKESDATCVRCHATANIGGPAPEKVDDFYTSEGVGCEACHGPGEKHVAAKGGTDNIEKLGDDCPVCVIEAVCTSCHTKEHDKDWDLDSHLPKVGHGTKK